MATKNTKDANGPEPGAALQPLRRFRVPSRLFVAKFFQLLRGAPR
jgi:hypothetical protein